MSGRRTPDAAERMLADALDAEAHVRAPERVLEQTFARTRSIRQARRRPWDGLEVPRRRATGPLILVAGLIVLGAGMFAIGGGGPGPFRSVTPPATRVPAVAAPVITSVCANGGGMAGDGRTLWIRCPTGIRRVDITTTPPTVGPVLEGIGLPVTLGGQLWAPGQGTVVRLDGATGAIVERLPVSGVSLLASDGSVLWAISGQRVLRIDPATGAAAAGGDTIAGAASITVVGGAPWVTSADGNARRIDPATLLVNAIVPVGDAPNAAAAMGGALYVVSQGRSGAVTRIDAMTGATVQVGIADPADPQSLGEVATGPSGVFVTRRTDLVVLDPTTLARLGVTVLPSYPSGLLVSGSTLWVFGDRLDRLAVPGLPRATPSGP